VMSLVEAIQKGLCSLRYFRVTVIDGVLFDCLVTPFGVVAGRVCANTRRKVG